MKVGSDEELELPLERFKLPGTDLQLSRLGFGTAALMSRVNRCDSVRLLETAFDAGITHFDTARSYGFGEAEIAVGDVLLGRRDKITVTTKVGILPPIRASWLSVAKAGARGLLGLAPGMRAQVRRRAGRLVRAGHVEPHSLAASLHTSLRQLRTDYVDVLLLHEPSVEILQRSEIWKFLERARSDGKVRYFGIAADSEVAVYALQHAPACASIVQLPGSALVQISLETSIRADTGLFVHSNFGGWLKQLHLTLAKHQRWAQRWSSLLNIDVLEEGGLERLTLMAWLAREPSAAVLFASTRPAHIRANAAALRGAALAEQLGTFEQLVLEWKKMRT